MAAALGLAATVGAAERVELTLEAAIDAALARNRELALAQVDVRRRELDIERARSEFNLEGGPILQSARIGDETQWTYGLQASKQLPTGTRVGASGQVFDRGGAFGSEQMVSVDISQPLFRRFGRQVAEEPLRLSHDQYRAERRRWESRRADLVLSIVGLFESITLLDAQARFEEDYIGRLKNLARLVAARERQGKATRVDTIRMELQQGEAGARLANVRERSAMASRELAETIGAALDTEFLVRPPVALDLGMPSPDAAVALALSNRLDVAQSMDDAATARRQGGIARRNRWPDINLGVSLRHSLLERTLPGDPETRTEWFAGATADGYPWRAADRIAVKQAELGEAAAESIVELRMESVSREVLHALSECRRAATELQIAVRNRELAASQAKLARRLYELGRSDGFSLSDAETRSAQTEIRLMEVTSMDRLSRYALLHAMGVLVEVSAELGPAAVEAL
jgi:outer membrane protein TolC